MGDATKIGFGNCTNITYRELFGLSYLLGYDSERMGVLWHGSPPRI